MTMIMSMSLACNRTANCLTPMEWGISIERDLDDKESWLVVLALVDFVAFAINQLLSGLSHIL